MLELLELIGNGCVGESALNSDSVESLYENRQTLNRKALSRWSLVTWEIRLQGSSEIKTT